MRHRTDPSKHLFFYTAAWWKSRYAMYRDDPIPVKKGSEIKYDPTADLSLLTTKGIECKYRPTKILSAAYLRKFFTLMTTTKDYSAIQDTCHDMTNYALPSTLTSLTSWKKSSDPAALNIMILGSGPVGLYTALYLSRLYPHIDTTDEFIKEFSFRSVNVLLVDNRIYKEGVRMPFSRSTQFWFNILELQPFLRQIFCWDNMMKRGPTAFDNIHVLESLLYTVAYKDGIPMAFTAQFNDYTALKTFIKKEQIHVLFDCTGGRSKIPISYSIRWPQSMKEGVASIRLNPATQYYEYYENGVSTSKPTLHLQIMDKKNRELVTGNHFAYPVDPADVALSASYNGQCFRVADFRKIAAHFKDEKLRNYFPHLLEISEIKEDAVHNVKINVFPSKARHSPFAAAPLLKGCTLIRVGDSLGGTEYGIMFGMKHSIEFSKHICSIMSTFL